MISRAALRRASSSFSRPACRLARALLGKIGTAFVGIGEGFEIHSQAVEYTQIVLEVLEQRLDDFLDLAVEALIAVGLLGPAHTGLGQAVEQNACRVSAAREQVLVEQGNLEERNLQPAQHGLHLRRQVAVLQDVFEQHADEINGVFVGAGHVGAVFAA